MSVGTTPVNKVDNNFFNLGYKKNHLQNNIGKRWIYNVYLYMDCNCVRRFRTYKDNMTEKQSAEFVQLVLLAFLFIYNAVSLRNAVVVLATNTSSVFSGPTPLFHCEGRGSMAKLKRLARILSGTL